ncbi:MAG: hypothetical protein ABI605_14060 [Rhizobacter sp.]
MIAIGLLAAGAAMAEDPPAAPGAPASAPTNASTPSYATPTPLPPIVPSGPAVAPMNPLVPAASLEAPSPFVLGIRQAFTSDSNLFRAPEGGLVVRDTLSSTGLHLGVDTLQGRQHINADLQANANRYRHNKQLDNTDYTAAARLDWETVERISGEVSAQQTQSLYRDTIASVVSTERNQVRTSSAAFQLRVGLVTLWSFEGGLAASENNYTGPDVDNRDLRQRSANAGVRWRPSDALSTRVAYRRTDGSYPSFGAEPDDFKRDDIDVITTTDVSGASRLNARLSATRERHTVQSQRDSNSWTGALGWHWQATGKTGIDVDLSRDNSVGRTGFDSSLINAEASDARLSQSATLSVTWAATSKIQVVPRAGYVRRNLDSGFTTGAGGASVQATDRTGIVGVGLRYQPAKSLDLGCDVAREQRGVDGAITLSSPYKVTTAGCSVQFALR